MLGTDGFKVPSIEETIELNIRMGSLTNSAIRCGGVSLHTGGFGEAEALRIIQETSQRLGVPVADPMRGGEQFEALVHACLKEV